MKLSVLLLLVATVSAIRLGKEEGEEKKEKEIGSGTPALSYEAKAASLKEVLDTVAEQ